MLRSWRWALVLLLAAGAAHAKSSDDEPQDAAPSAHVTIDAEPLLQLKILPLHSEAPLAECQGQCELWAAPGAYELRMRNTDTGAQHQLRFRLKTSSHYELSEGDETARYAGLAIGITGAAVIFTGIVLIAPAVLAAGCEGSDCVSNGERRAANVGLGFLAAGAIATPIGWVMFSSNRPRLQLLSRSHSSLQPSFGMGPVEVVPGAPGLGAYARF